MDRLKQFKVVFILTRWLKCIVIDYEKISYTNSN